MSLLFVSFSQGADQDYNPLASILACAHKLESLSSAADTSEERIFPTNRHRIAFYTRNSPLFRDKKEKAKEKAIELAKKAGGHWKVAMLDPIGELSTDCTLTVAEEIKNGHPKPVLKIQPHGDFKGLGFTITETSKKRTIVMRPAGNVIFVLPDGRTTTLKEMYVFNSLFTPEIDGTFFSKVEESLTALERVTAAPPEVVDKFAKDPTFAGMIDSCGESLTTCLEALNHKKALITDSEYELFRCVAATFLGVSEEQLGDLTPFLRQNHPVIFARIHESFDVEKGQPVVELFS